MALVGGADGLHQHLPAHAEVTEQGVAVVEGQPEVLPASAGGLDPAAGQGRGEAGGPTRVAAYRAGVQHLDGGDGGADGVGVESAADDLDLGQLGHGGQSSPAPLDPDTGTLSAAGRPSATAASAISRYAVSAACCSASFLERPTPWP